MIRNLNFDDLAAYATVPSVIEVAARWTPTEIVPVDRPWRKDYDAVWPLIDLPNHFDVTYWGVSGVLDQELLTRDVVDQTWPLRPRVRRKPNHLVKAPRVLTVA